MSEEKVIEMMNELISGGEMQVNSKDGEVECHWVDKMEKSIMQSLKSEEQLVYTLIETSGQAGLETKQIKVKSGLNVQQLNKVLNKLTSQGMVKFFKLKNRKVYIHYLQ